MIFVFELIGVRKRLTLYYILYIINYILYIILLLNFYMDAISI